MASAATVRVKCDDVAAGYVIINESDFDATIHERHGDDTRSPASRDDLAANRAKRERARRMREGVPTVRILNPDNGVGYHIINEADFQPSVHVLYPDDAA